MRVGRLDVQQLREELSPEEMDWWMQFHEAEPLGLDRLYRLIADVGAAIVCACRPGADIGGEHFLTWLPLTERMRMDTDLEMKGKLSLSAAAARAQ